MKFLELASCLNPFNFNIACYTSIVLESLGHKIASLDVLLKAEEKNSPTAVVYYRKAKLYESLELFEVNIYFFLLVLNFRKLKKLLKSRSRNFQTM